MEENRREEFLEIRREEGRSFTRERTKFLVCSEEYRMCFGMSYLEECTR